MHKITFTERIDIDTLVKLVDFLDNKLDLGVLNTSSVQCHAEERDMVIEVLDDMGIDYREGEAR